MELDNEKIEQAIIASVSDSLIAESELEARIRAAVDARIDAHFKSIGDIQIQAAVNKAIAEGFEHEYRRVDEFGRAQGGTTTIRAELNRLVGGYWNERVDKNGKKTDSSYSSTTRAEWMMCQLVAADFQGEMKQHIVNLGGSLKDHLRLQLRSTLDSLLSEVFHVQSDGDRELKNPGRSCIDPPQKGKA